MLNKIPKCEQKSCFSGTLITDQETGELLCSSCGRVLIDRVEEHASEYRIFNKEDYLERSRRGMKSSLAIYDKGLFTVIGHVNKDASGKFLSGDAKTIFNRLRILDSRSKLKSSNVNLIQSFLILDAAKTKLAIPESVVEKAAYIFRKALANKIWTVRGHSSMMLASLYAACRETITPRTLQEVALAGNIKRRDLIRTYRTLVNALDLKLPTYNPSEFVTRICNTLGLSEKTHRLALTILSKSQKDFYGKNPMSLAAASVYTACTNSTEKKSQLEIANVAGISCVTLRNTCLILKGSLL